MTLGRTGIRRTVGIPGTGIYYTSHTGIHSGFHSAHTETPVDPRTQAAASGVAGLMMLAIIVVAVLLIGIAIGAALNHG